MNSDLVKKALDVIESQDANAALDLLKQWIASAAGADPDAAPDSQANALPADAPTDGDEPGSEGDGAEGVPAPKKAKPLKTEHPKIDEAAVKRGRAAMGWESPKQSK